MRVLTLILTLISLNLFAADCVDSNLNGIEMGTSYDDLQYFTRFELLFESDSAAPAGFSDTFGLDSELCRDVTATYIKHYDGTKYVMYTTHDDYCDGGNTIGIMVNLTKYADEDSKLEDAIVATIGDSEFYCN